MNLLKVLGTSGLETQEVVNCTVSAGNNSHVCCLLPEAHKPSIKLEGSEEIVFTLTINGNYFASVSVPLPLLPKTGKAKIPFVKDKHIHMRQTQDNAKTKLLVLVYNEFNRLQSHISNLNTVKDDLEKQVNTYETLYKQERYQREFLEKQIDFIAYELSSILSLHTNREADLCKELHKRNSDISELETQINLLKEQNRAFYFQRAQHLLDNSKKKRKSANIRGLIRSTVESVHSKLRLLHE